MVVAIFGLALTNTWNAILLFTVYLSLEGMYKYTSNFSQFVYIVAPLLSATIFVAWGIRTRSEAERKEANQGKADLPAKNSLFQNQSGKDEIGLPKLAPLVFALIALSFLQAANPDSPGIVNSLNGAIVWYIGPLSFFFITYYTLRHRTEAMGFIYTMVVTGFIVSAYAVIQFYLGKAWVDSHVPGMQNMASMSYALIGGVGPAEEGAYRPASTAPIAGGYVVASSLSMLAALCVATIPRMAVWRRTAALLSTTVLAMALAVSSVRLVALSLLVAIPVLLSLSARRFEDTIRIYFMIFTLGALLTTSFVVADITANGKLSRRYGSVFTSNPLSSYGKNRGGSLSYVPRAIAIRPFGIGIRRGTRGSADMIRGKDVGILNDRETQWNSIHADLGVFGLLSLAAFFIGTLTYGLRICRTLPDRNLRSVAVLMYVIILFDVILSFGSPILQANYIFWSACGVLFALPRLAAEERKILMQSTVTSNLDSKVS
ncbi:MAG: hypothetical protein H7145_15310 [Akkermansiaceae bacterium]|nr:hypothetical protein [Armatimonadota bacterium]